MPILHPDPPRIPANLQSEREVLSALRTLPPEAHVFGRLNILNAKENKERELDFLVLHPELGLVIIEVKGKGVELRAEGWVRLDRNGRPELMKETPAEQLGAQDHALRNYLHNVGVGFVPQVTRVLALPALPLREGQDLGPDLPACRILTRGKLKGPFVALREAVAGGAPWESWRASAAARHHRIPPDLMTHLVQALTPRILPPPCLAELMVEEANLQDAPASLLLDHLAENLSRGRFQVAGAPGSGKSLLARKVAQTWVSEGRKVLMVAYNRAITFATQCALDPLIHDGRVTASTYHDLAATLLDAMGRKPPFVNNESFYHQDLPAAFAALVADPDALAERWDALIVDEAQDLDPAWVRSLLGLLRDPERDPALLLEDPAQSLFRQGVHQFGAPWRLDLSLRMHSAIRRAACLAYPACGWSAPDAGPDEGAVTLIDSGPQRWRQDLDEVLNGLAQEGVQPHQVMVLSRHKAETLKLKDGDLLGPWPLNPIADWWEGERWGQVRVGSIQAFKGLEVDVVVYLEPQEPDAQDPRLAYTAYSRARHRLIVLRKALASKAEPAAKQTVAQAPAKPTEPRRPQVRTFSAEERGKLLTALSAASSWKPGTST